LKTANRLRRTMQDLQAQLDALDNISPKNKKTSSAGKARSPSAQRRDDFMRQMGGVI
jgi:hypothetical protein